MKSIASKTLRAPINVDDGYTNHRLSDDCEQTLELYKRDDNSYYIEWDIPAIQDTEYINIEHENMRVTGYDGVFELSGIHIEFLEENGFNCEEMKEMAL